MKDMKNVDLCSNKEKDLWIHVWASITDGELAVSGQDLGSYVENSWGDSDYEYWYTFTTEETVKLLDVIGGAEDPEAALVREFNGVNGCRKLVRLCDREGIKYSFYSYV